MRYPRLIWENENGLSAEFSVYSDDFFCNVQRDVKGLSDVTAKINTITNVGQDGETETSVYLDPRDITIKGQLRTNDFLLQNELIRRLNRILDPHHSGTLTYIMGEARRKITCRALSAPVWAKSSKRPVFTITLFCPNPYWSDTSTTLVQFAGGSAAFHFPLPFYSDVNTLWEWPVIMGAISTLGLARIQNDSDSDCGMIWEAAASGEVINPLLINVDTGDYIKLNLTLQNGDVLRVTTAYGKKRVRLIRNGEDLNAYSSVVLGSTFFPIYKGANNLSLRVESGGAYLDCRIGFEGQYLGVGL